MTPVAHLIMKDATRQVKDREFVSEGFDWGEMSDIHCFECSDVSDLAADLTVKMLDDMRGGNNMIDGRLAFLPADNTWIEWRDTDYSWRIRETQVSAGVRSLADYDHTQPEVALLRRVDQSRAGFFQLIPGLRQFSERTDARQCLGDWYNFPVASDPKINVFIDPDTESTRGREGRWETVPGYGNIEDDGGVWGGTYSAMFVYALLAIINSPRIIGRRQHMPHRGLERELLRSRQIIGKFPLRAWTEIKLHVMPPLAGDGTHEAHLTGMRALHFCRSHLRIRLGQLELVRGHWRGDAAMGVKRSRYKLLSEPASPHVIGSQNQMRAKAGR